MSDQDISSNLSATCDELPVRFRIGGWLADARTGELQDGHRLERLEPKIMELLRLFADRPGQVLSREQILAAVWPGVVAADDALARAIFKLRRALGDDAKAARYIETLPKRGYRLIAEVEVVPPKDDSLPKLPAQDAYGRTATATLAQSHGARSNRWIAIAIGVVTIALAMAWFPLDRTPSPPPSEDAEGNALIERADDFYYRYSRADNEAAIELYERILAREPDRVEALRGLANAFVQRMIRWPSLPAGESEVFTTLTASVRNGHLQEPASRRILERAELLARRAIALNSADSLSQRALGLALASQSRFDEAIVAYRAAIALDADAWGALVNLYEALDLTGKSDEATQALIAAHEAMTRRYARDKQYIQPYYADAAVLVGKRLVDSGRSIEGETWFRRALTYSPLHPSATLALASLLEDGGRGAEARQLCLQLNARIGEQSGCTAVLDSGKEMTAPGK